MVTTPVQKAPVEPTLHRYRIVKYEGSDSQGGFICADPQGLPFLEGHQFFTWLIEVKGVTPDTAFRYLKLLLAYLTALWQAASVTYGAPVSTIREQTVLFLRNRLGCVVWKHKNGNYQVKRPRLVTPATARQYLVVARHFYDFAIETGLYADPNPLVWSEGRQLRRLQFVPTIPPISGLSRPDEKQGRMPDTYFCLVGDEWQPRLIDDPNLPRHFIPQFEHRRDQLVSRILFESGARIGEVLALTLGDWRQFGLQPRAAATNKGDGVARVKQIWWSAETNILLHHYVNHERYQMDSLKQKLHDLPDSEPLFLNFAGRPYIYHAFYHHWDQTCRKVNLKLHPHQARHWFVTMALYKIQSLPEAKQEVEIQNLITYMAWKNPMTIHTYQHHVRQTQFAPTHRAVSKLVTEGIEPVASMQAGLEAPTENQHLQDDPVQVDLISAELSERLWRIIEQQ
jgi:integrase